MRWRSCEGSRRACSRLSGRHAVRSRARRHCAVRPSSHSVIVEEAASRLAPLFEPTYRRLFTVASLARRGRARLVERDDAYRIASSPGSAGALRKTGATRPARGPPTATEQGGIDETYARVVEPSGPAGGDGGPCGRLRLGHDVGARLERQPVAGQRQGHPQAGLDGRPGQPQPVHRHDRVGVHRLVHELRHPGRSEHGRRDAEQDHRPCHELDHQPRRQGPGRSPFARTSSGRTASR